MSSSGGFRFKKPYGEGLDEEGFLEHQGDLNEDHFQVEVQITISDI